MGLTRTAIVRPVFILMLMLSAFLLGTIAYRSMRLELNPEVNLGVVTVSTVYAGAGPEEINNLISRKIEEAVSGVNGLREVTSTSREGLSTVVVSLDLGVDVNVALNDVRSKVDSVTNSLPKDAQKPQVSKVDISAQPILYLSFTSKTLNSRDLRDLIDQKLQDRFGQIPGVASADVQGGDQREIQVRVKKDKLLSYGLGITDVQRAVAAATLNAPAGRLLSGAQEFSVRVLGEFQSIDEIRNMVFTVLDPRNPGGKAVSVHLSDVATVEDSVKERTSYARLDGRDNIVISLQKTHDGNAVEITKGADATIAAIEKEYAPQGIRIQKTLESAKQITESLTDLNFALFFGIFLVALIVYIFLHNFRGTLIVILAIPTSIFCTFVALNLLGFTINNMSMLSLSLAIGVLVDDAIVVLENIYRHLRMGEDPQDAALNGRSEIGLAAIAITFADVVVFLPIAFMGGVVGQFFKPLAVGFVCATLFSLFVSFTLTPMLASRWYRKGEDMEHFTKGFAGWFENVFGRVQRFYGRTLEWALNHRWFVFILGNMSLFAVFMFIAGGFAGKLGDALSWSKYLFIPTVILGFVLFLIHAVRGKFVPKVILNAALFGLIFPVAAMAGFAFGQYKKEAVFKFSFLPSSDSGQVTVSIELPPGSNLAETEKVVEKIEAKVKSNPDTKYVLSTVGTQGGGGFGGGGASGSNYAQVAVTLNDKAAFMDRISGSGKKLRYRSASSVAADMMQTIGRIPGADIRVSGGDSLGFGLPIQMSFASDDRKLLVATVTKIEEGLRQGAVKGVINPDLSSKPGKPEIQAVPDRVRAADAGVSNADIAAAVRTLYEGNDDAKYRVNGTEYPIRVMMDLKDRDDPNLISSVPLKFVGGSPILLGAVAPLKTAPALDKIDRRNRIEEIRVTADLLPGYAAGSVQAQIDAWIKKNNLVPAGVVSKPLGQADFQAREMGFIFGAMGIGLVLVYMLLASLFNNLLYPMIIQMAQPQAMTGALLALVLTDKAFNLVGYIGLITLVGLVGKNAILLVDYTNTLRERGRNRHDALVEAGPIRLRPILMTTMALILGMLPVALAIGRGSEFRETIGITVIGGMLLSTMLTLLVIPCSYTIFDDFSHWFGRVLRRDDSAIVPPPMEEKEEAPDTDGRTPAKV